MKRLIFSICLLLTSSLAYSAVIGKTVDYKVDDVILKGYLAVDDSIKGERPGILVVHEWWGHNDYARKRADMLAELGYTAFAVDMYGEGKNTEHPKEAGEWSSQISKNVELGKTRFLAALDLLKQQETVDAEKIAAIGYCFGGGVVLTMARLGVDLKGVASFHGSLSTDQPAKAGAVKAKVLVFHGEADALVTPEIVEAFKKEMQTAKVDLEFVNYPDVKHSFTNPNADKIAKEYDLPIAYNEQADKDSWAKLQDFFKRIFTK
jgi:dienelactone hydrolase